MENSSFLRGCTCAANLPAFHFHSLMTRVRVKQRFGHSSGRSEHTTIHKHTVLRADRVASPTHILEVSQRGSHIYLLVKGRAASVKKYVRGNQFGFMVGDNSLSGAKKTGRRSKTEDTKPEETESVTYGGKTYRGSNTNERELVLSDGRVDVERDEFIEIDLQVEEIDKGNGNNFSNNWPPLVCCFGAAENKFTPISARYMSADLCSLPESLQCNPACLVKQRGGPPSNVAIELARLGGRVAFMGKVGNDAYGRQMVITLNMNNVQTCGVRVDPSSSTSVSYMKLNHRDGKLGMMCIKPCAQDALVSSEINMDILREARMLHFTSMALHTKSMQSTLLVAIKFSKKCGSAVFFNVNLPLPLWRPQKETRRIIQQAWDYSNVIVVSKQELEFLLDKDYFKKKRTVRGWHNKMEPLNYCRPTREELSSLWHNDLKILFVNDGANLYYYTPTFDSSVPGFEDPCLTGFSYDRSASSDTFIAEIMSRLVMEPELYNHQVNLDKVIRYATTSATVAQGIISHTRQYATDSQEYKMKVV